MTVSAYIPCFNNSATVLESVNSLRRQTVRVAEVFVVDDGSTDDSVARLEQNGVRVIRMEQNRGRGAVRARAMLEAGGELVLCCDATNVLPENFLAQALPWFAEERVVAVFGRMSQPPGGNAVLRWRGRHLFRIPGPGVPLGSVNRRGQLATYGAVVRRAAVLSAGNYDVRLRHTEDADLGQRLLARDWDVVMDPSLVAVSLAQNTLAQVLERYWRWNAGKDEAVSLAGYLRTVWYAVRAMAPADLKERDWPAALISLYAPHYQFWRSFFSANRQHPQA